MNGCLVCAGEKEVAMSIFRVGQMVKIEDNAEWCEEIKGD